MPAYNAGATLKETYDNIPMDIVDNIILVDDCSKDNTVEVARSLNINTIVHEKNLDMAEIRKLAIKKRLNWIPIL